MSDINLLPNKNKRKIRLYRFFRFLRVFSLVFVALVFVVTVGAIFLQIFSPLAELKSRQQSQLDELASYNKRIAKYLFLQDRLQNIHNVLASRTTYEEVFAKLITQLPSGVTVRTLFIDDTQMTIAVVSKELSKIDEFIKRVTAESPVKTAKRVTVHSVSYNQNGKTYTASLSFK